MAAGEHANIRFAIDGFGIVSEGLPNACVRAARRVFKPRLVGRATRGSADTINCRHSRQARSQKIDTTGLGVQWILFHRSEDELMVTDLKERDAPIGIVGQRTDSRAYA